MGVKCVVEHSAPALSDGEVAEQRYVYTRDQGRHGFLGGIQGAAEVGADDEIEQSLLDSGDPALAEFGPVTLDVEVRDIAANEEHCGFAVGELQRVSVAPHGDDRDIEGAWDGAVDAGRADAHQSAVGRVAARARNAERSGL
jgi:hypothetical protein